VRKKGTVRQEIQQHPATRKEHPGNKQNKAKKNKTNKPKDIVRADVDHQDNGVENVHWNGKLHRDREREAPREADEMKRERAQEPREN
jgi:hypothetical protein